MAEQNTEKKEVSTARLRVGVVLLLLWLLPFWMLGPTIAAGLDMSAATVSAIIVVAQTVIGLIGAFVAGREVTAVVKGIPLRKMPKKVWQILLNGSVGS